MVSNPVRALDEKPLYFLREHVPSKLVESAPLRAIAIPRVTGARDTRTRPAPGEPRSWRSPPARSCSSRGGRSTLHLLAAAVRAVPCHFLDAGTDPEQGPAALASLLAT